jgi:hypothetical protein
VPVTRSRDELSGLERQGADPEAGNTPDVAWDRLETTMRAEEKGKKQEARWGRPG